MLPPIRHGGSAAAGALLWVLLAPVACERPEPAPERLAPWIVVGVDGGERQAIERLWARGELPVLRSLANRGVFADLATDYGISPAIWTTIATGVPPPRHGITDFVVPTESGDVPVSSAARRVPALWNMLTRSRRRVAVLGWWATWPAESVDGVVVSDRLELELPDRIHPPDRGNELQQTLDAALSGGIDFGANRTAETRDRVVTDFAERSVREPYDLVLAYLRSVDPASHTHWREFEAASIRGVEANGDADPVTIAYRGLDLALGRILAAAPVQANVVVLSDHGFRALRRERVHFFLNFDRVLAALGLLVADGPAVDLERSFAYTYDSPEYRVNKFVRFAPPGVELDDQVIGRARERLARELAAVTFGPDCPAFRVRAPKARERQRGAHAVAMVDTAAAIADLRLHGRPLHGALRHLGRLTGDHPPHKAGIFLAAGPAIRNVPLATRISVHDVTPTLLLALGLPIADDFAGRPVTELFTEEFVRNRQVRRIASWGVREAGAAPRTADDRKLLEELAGLGYLR